MRSTADDQTVRSQGGGGLAWRSVSTRRRVGKSAARSADGAVQVSPTAAGLTRPGRPLGPGSREGILVRGPREVPRAGRAAVTGVASSETSCEALPARYVGLPARSKAIASGPPPPPPARPVGGLMSQRATRGSRRQSMPWNRAAGTRPRQARLAISDPEARSPPPNPRTRRTGRGHAGIRKERSRWCVHRSSRTGGRTAPHS